MRHSTAATPADYVDLDTAESDPSLALDLPDPSTIPDVVIRRLPIYVRTLRNLHGQDILTVSSDELAEHIGVTAAQIRRDLSYFGRFGKQGKGYDTGFLADRIAEILGVNAHWDVALAGVGNLGQAVLRYRGFSPPTSSFNIVAVFDRGHHGANDRIDGIPILSTDRMTEVIRQRQIRVGIIAVPPPLLRTSLTEWSRAASVPCSTTPRSCSRSRTMSPSGDRPRQRPPVNDVLPPRTLATASVHENVRHDEQGTRSGRAPRSRFQVLERC